MSLNPHLALFLLATALMLVHEMDAVRCREWRIFPLLEWLDERPAMLCFVWLHVPLIWAIIYFSAGSMQAGGNGFSAAFSGFCVVHAGLHLIYERHPRNELRNALSRSIIWGCAAAGLAALVFYWL